MVIIWPSWWFWISHMNYMIMDSFLLCSIPQIIPFIILFFNGSLILRVVVTAIGPSILQHQCKVLWRPIQVDILYHPVLSCQQFSCFCRASDFFQLESFHTVKVKQSPSNNTVAGSIHNSICYQADTRKETTVFVSPESLFSDHLLLMVTCYGCYTGKTSHKLVHSMWNSSFFWL